MPAAYLNFGRLYQLRPAILIYKLFFEIVIDLTCQVTDKVRFAVSKLDCIKINHMVLNFVGLVIVKSREGSFNELHFQSDAIC